MSNDNGGSFNGNGRKPARACSARCPGWSISRAFRVQHCKHCETYWCDEEAYEGARAAGLDVQQDGYVAGIFSQATRQSCAQPKSETLGAIENFNDLLVWVLERLTAAQDVLQVPRELKSAANHLMVEVAKAQGVSEWLVNDLVKLVEQERNDGSI